MSDNLPTPVQPDTTPVLPDSEEYWQQWRDAANEARRKAGLPELPPNWRPAPLQPTPLELALRQEAIKEQAIKGRELAARDRELEIKERQLAAKERELQDASQKPKRSGKKTPGREASLAVIAGVRLWRKQKSWATIRHQCCPLIPGYSEIPRDQTNRQEDEWQKLQGAIRKYISRHKVRRGKKFRGQKQNPAPSN